MPQRQYDKATAQALMQLAYPEYENLPSAPYIENEKKKRKNLTSLLSNVMVQPGIYYAVRARERCAAAGTRTDTASNNAGGDTTRPGSDAGGSVWAGAAGTG